ncbi:hypothetical protein ElyMa_004385100 [Elysia marginata]|uniref:Uncharacterized protein n=1 Tax=Elysia marginata TaxID=1093978 RepID=A0AAV4H9H5_9GAST|nr:hypothetical protein ElyMa_004385100 [Elysia marginata]
MAAILKLAVLTLVMALTFVSAKPVERERRFLVESIVDGAKAVAGGITGTFHRFFGRQFAVEDENQALSDADALRGYGHTFHDLGVWFTTAAESFRKSLYHEATTPDLNEWKISATLMTQLGDELLLNDKEFITVNNWIRLTITDTLKPDHRSEDRFRLSLDTIRAKTERLENLVPLVSQALTKLRDLADSRVTKDIEDTLKKVARTAMIVAKVRDRFDSLVKAIGIENY